MNELNKKIESMLEHSLPIMPDNQVELLTNDLSKFLLEKMKEAWIRGYDSKTFDPEKGIISTERFDDYLKSKYNL